MPQSIPAGLTRDHVLSALADLDSNAQTPFGQPTGYELVHEGRRYAPKAVVGIACKFSQGRMLRPDEFSGGEAPGQANFVLRRLGFTVLQKGVTISPDTNEPERSPWSEQEVEAIVADYFSMLTEELHGRAYSKTEHRQALTPLLVGRSKGSIEFKHANISAVLVELGLPYIDGYKPRGNYQALLAASVESYLDQHSNLMAELAIAPVVQPAVPLPAVPPDFNAVVEAPPEITIAPRSREKPWLTRRARRIDFAEIDALNRHLGRLGEEFVVQLEKHRLLSMGRDDLAHRIKWVARDIGDGVGFDVLSFDDVDDSERFLEVKTTGLAKHFPFYVTANELSCSQDVPDKYQLYRLFDFAKAPRLYILQGALDQVCQLQPTLFRGTPRSTG